MTDTATLAPVAAAVSATLTRPLIGQPWPEQGGALGAILPGRVIDGVQQPDVAIIVPTDPAAEFKDVQWGNYGKKIDGADSDIDSAANTLAMLAAGSTLAAHIAALRIGGHADWVLPSIRHLRALAAAVPHLFSKDDWYWSSTQYSAHDAWAQDFERGYSKWFDEVYEFRARAVRLIQL